MIGCFVLAISCCACFPDWCLFTILASIASITRTAPNSAHLYRWKIASYRYTATQGQTSDRTVITQADQALRVKIDEFGAEAAAMTTMSVLRGARPVLENIVLGNTGYFLAWFTEGSSMLPVCVMVANADAYSVTD